MVAAKFIDMQTRAVFVDVTVFNPMLDLTTQVRLVAEMSKGGGVRTWYGEREREREREREKERARERERERAERTVSVLLHTPAAAYHR
jgi:hypothetical protein